MKKRKLIFVLLGIVAYLFVGVKQAEFITNSMAKDPIERSTLEKTVTFSLFMSEEELQISSAIHEQRQVDKDVWEDKTFKNKLWNLTFGWVIAYLILLIGYTAFFLWQLKWIILGIIALALYTNFGYWLGNYLYNRHGTTDFIALFFTKSFIKVNWEQAKIEGDEHLWKFLFTIVWPLYAVAAFVTWIMIILYKIVATIWWLVKKIIWLITAGPVRDNIHQNTKTGRDILR